MKNFEKLDKKVDYNYLEADVLIQCDCGNDVYMNYHQPRECDVCGRIYVMSLSVNEYERI